MRHPLTMFGGPDKPVAKYEELTDQQIDQAFKEIREAVGVFHRERGVK